MNIIKMNLRVLCFVHNLNFWLVNGFAALVPLEELRELNFTKQYGIARDPEVIDMLDTASKTKGVYLRCFLYVTCFYRLEITHPSEIKQI